MLATQACDKRHTEQLELLVAAWMKATGASVPAAASSTAAGGSATSAAPGGVAALQASISSLTSKQALGRGASAALDGGAAGGGGGAGTGSKPGKEGGGAAGRGGNGEGDEEEEEREEDGEDVASLSDLDEDAEAAEAAFLQWQGSVGATTASPFAADASAPPLPYHIRIEMRRLVQDPGGSYAAGVDVLSAGLAGGGAAAASAAAAAAAAAASAAAIEPLPTSSLAPEPVLTAAQRQWVSYVCAVSATLLWAVPGLWATCHSAKYGNQPDLEEDTREGLGRGPSLARRLVEELCAKYAQRLK